MLCSSQFQSGDGYPSLQRSANGRPRSTGQLAAYLNTSSTQKDTASELNHRFQQPLLGLAPGSAMLKTIVHMKYDVSCHLSTFQ